MSGFSPEWLALREPVDHRSRNGELAAKVARRFAGRDSVEVIDLGCGSGSNLRATWALLPDRQRWTLVDYDSRLLAAARERLVAWADHSDSDGDGLRLTKAGKQLRVGFRQADLTRELDAVLGPAATAGQRSAADLVTASALFDLASVAFIATFAAAVAARRAAFYTVLTYDGVQTWTPGDAVDGPMRDAFHAHQQTDKGFGAAAGPGAPAAMRDAFIRAGYRVEDGDSPWRLGPDDRALIADLATGFANAVAETGKVEPATLARWRGIERLGSIVGHTDTWAVPA